MNIELIDNFSSEGSDTILARIDIDGIKKIVKYRFYISDLKKIFTYFKSLDSKKKLTREKDTPLRKNYIKKITELTGNIETKYKKWLSKDLRLLSEILTNISDKLGLTRGLEYEAAVYKLLRMLEIHKYSPHFIMTDNSIKDVSFFDLSKPTKFIGILEEMKVKCWIDEDKFNPPVRLKRVKGVIMEYCNKCKLYSKIIYDKTLSENDQVVILFQILYNLTVIKRLKIQHNDLHLSNILIKKSKRPQTRLYCIGNNINRWYSITSQYSVKFFDWDLAYSPKIGKNKKIEGFYCHELDICNTLHPLFDQTIVLCQLMRAHPNKSIKTFLKNNSRLPTELINTAVFDCRISAHNFLKHKNIITSAASLMKNSFFNRFKINKNNTTIINEKNIYTLPKVYVNKNDIYALPNVYRKSRI